MCGNTCLRSLLFSKPQHTTRAHNFLFHNSCRIASLFAICNTKYGNGPFSLTWDITGKANRPCWQQCSQRIAGVDSYQHCCGRLQKLSPDLPPVRVQVYTVTPRSKRHTENSLGQTGPIKPNKSTVMVARSNSEAAQRQQAGDLPSCGVIYHV